jgi:hypothetical protein
MPAGNLNVLTVGAALLLLAGASALPQEMRPYNIETFGVFRNLMMTGDFSPKVRLADAMALEHCRTRAEKSRFLMAS